MYVWVFQVASFLQVSLPKPPNYLFPPYMLHALPTLSLLDLITTILVGEDFELWSSVKKQKENSHLEDSGIDRRILLRMLGKSGVIYHVEWLRSDW